MKRNKDFFRFAYLVLVALSVALFVTMFSPDARRWIDKNVLAPRVGCVAVSCFHEALSKGDGLLALKYAKYYEKWEKKYNAKRRKYNPSCDEKCESNFYYMNAYEALGEYD
ncbi:MAG: hypothetical protein J6X44_05710 [Thermoguttaceae bacterium]|nr:hypothetical protein [Thermoguttaceae bacterium]